MINEVFAWTISPKGEVRIMLNVHKAAARDAMAMQHGWVTVDDHDLESTLSTFLRSINVVTEWAVYLCFCGSTKRVQ